MRDDIKTLLNEIYAILCCIADHERTCNGETACHRSQLTMARQLNMSRMTFSNNLHNLIANGFVEPRGRELKKYMLTDRGRLVIESIRNIWYKNSLAIAVKSPK